MKQKTIEGILQKIEVDGLTKTAEQFGMSLIDLVKKCDNFYGVWDSLIKINKLKLSNIHPIKWLAFDKIEHLENG